MSTTPLYNEPMILETFPVGPLQCNCSVIGDEQTREAIVIDPGDEIDEVMAVVQRHGLSVKQIVVTHAHIDHVGGAMKLKRLTGAGFCENEGRRSRSERQRPPRPWMALNRSLIGTASAYAACVAVRVV